MCWAYNREKKVIHSHRLLIWLKASQPVTVARGMVAATACYSHNLRTLSLTYWVKNMSMELGNCHSCTIIVSQYHTLLHTKAAITSKLLHSC